jgi:UDP-glucose 4-epimerase
MTVAKEEKVKPERRVIVAGGAGFIGTNLAAALIPRGYEVILVDNLSNGSRRYIDCNPSLEAATFLEADLADRASCDAAFAQIVAAGPVEAVWHMAANSDIPAGVSDPDIDHRDTFLTTFEILRSMRNHGIDTLHFASSSAIYGDLGEQVLHEDVGPLFPISNYGAMKLASEAQLSAAGESFLKRVNIFRFPNVVGIPATHGVLLDFIRKLAVTPDCLEVLGDGTQQKSYLHVSDLVDAMLLIAGRDATGVLPVNIGPVDDGVTVRFIAEAVVLHVNAGARISFGQGNKGWVGDVPRFTYSTERLQSYGWLPQMGSREAVLRAISEIASQEGNGQ